MNSKMYTPIPYFFYEFTTISSSEKTDKMPPTVRLKFKNSIFRPVIRQHQKRRFWDGGN